MLIIRGLLGGVLQVAIIAALLLIPAWFVTGDWDWPRLWILLAIYCVALVTMIVCLAVLAPASLEARLRAPASREQPREDAIATAFLLATFALFLVFIPIDVFAWQLMGAVPDGIAALGMVLFVAGYAFIGWVIYTNSFAIPIVEDQSDAGQALVDTGPYARIRHPMYTGILAYFGGLGLWLQSWASLLVLALMLVALVFRIRVEEKTLRATLPGYDDYAQRCRWRLVPGLW